MTSLTVQTYRLQLVREQQGKFETEPVLDCPQAVSKQLSPLFDGLDREQLRRLGTGREKPSYRMQYRVGRIALGVDCPSSRSLQVRHPCQRLKYHPGAHPSGDVSPSQDDTDLTRRIVEAGTLMGIDVLDHLIVADGDFLSMKERGLM